MSNYTNNVESVSFVCSSLQWCQCWWCRDRARHSTKFWRSSDGSAAAGTLDSNTGRQLQQPRHRVQVYLDLGNSFDAPPLLPHFNCVILTPWMRYFGRHLVSFSLFLCRCVLYELNCLWFAAAPTTAPYFACSYLKRNKLHFYKDIKIITMSPFFCWVTIKRLERKRKNV